jgi:hypothetical protein
MVMTTDGVDIVTESVCRRERDVNVATSRSHRLESIVNTVELNSPEALYSVELLLLQCSIVASPVPAALTKCSQMWSVTFAREERSFDVDPRPVLQPVHNSLDVRVIHVWPAHFSTLLVPLMVYFDIFGCVGCNWVFEQINGSVLVCKCL